MKDFVEAQMPSTLEPSEMEVLSLDKDPLPEWIDEDKTRIGGTLALVHGVMGDTTYFSKDGKRIYLSPKELEAYYNSGRALGGFADVQHQGPNSRIGRIIAQHLTKVRTDVGGREEEKPVIDFAVDITDFVAQQNLLSRHFDGTSAAWIFQDRAREDGLTEATNLDRHPVKGAITFAHGLGPQKLGCSIYRIYKRGDT